MIVLILAINRDRDRVLREFFSHSEEGIEGRIIRVKLGMISLKPGVSRIREPQTIIIEQFRDLLFSLYRLISSVRFSCPRK